MKVILTEEPISSSELLADFTSSVRNAGAIVSFSGLVRDYSSDAEVINLYLQAYSPMTENSIRSVIETANTHWPLTGVRVLHRIGLMNPRDEIVFVATASEHRRAAFDSADFLMDFLKTKAIFWKKETRSDGEFWIEPRPQDYQDIRRWDSMKSDVTVA